jgi:peptidoglycan/xylan/chitin deacetylase (PgdA/CDA1 family)
MDLLPWQKVAFSGHEIGNHTVSHPCSENFPFISEFDRSALEEMSLDEMEAEIVEAGKRLSRVIPGQDHVSFAYPCYQPFVGKGLTRQSYVPLVAKHCVAGRGRGERSNDPRRCDVAYLWSWPCERSTGAHLVGLVEQAVVEGRWAILTFHGVHEGHLPIGDGDLLELCMHLKEQKDRVWTAPVATIGAYVADWQSERG